LETTYQHLQGLDKDSRRKAKARTKDYKFVLKDNQGPRTKAKDNITDQSTLIILRTDGRTARPWQATLVVPRRLTHSPKFALTLTQATIGVIYPQGDFLKSHIVISGMWQLFLLHCHWINLGFRGKWHIIISTFRFRSGSINWTSVKSDERMLSLQTRMATKHAHNVENVIALNAIPAAEYNIV